MFLEVLCQLSHGPKLAAVVSPRELCVILQTSAGLMLVNTNVKLQMTVEIALPALSSLCSVSDY